MKTPSESLAQQTYHAERASFVHSVQELVKRYGGCVPEIASRLNRVGGFVYDQPLTATEISKIPLLRKAAVRDLQALTPPWGAMLEEGFKPEVCFMSPGGIVEPLVPRMVERLAELLEAVGFAATHRVLNGFNYHFTPAGLLFHSALIRLGCSVLPVGPQQTSMQAEFASLMDANAFVGIASHLKILLDQQPGLSIGLAMAGAEPHGEAIRAHLLSQHGVQCFDMYGFAEAGILAASCAEAGALHFHPDVLTEVLDLESARSLGNAEAGELVISVDNPGFPLLRFATGDLVTLEPRLCACKQFGILKLLGRTDQSARVKGMLLHQSQLRLFLDQSKVSACRLEVTRLDGRDRLVLKIYKATHESDTQTLETIFRETCRLRADQLEFDDTLAPDSCSIVDLRVK